ncbi:MAG: hypothetical protein RQ869_02055 [Candidatus Nanopusillus sp.]|nr:hypothetical protein [Candidatus Nanopusillus sp.]
MVKKQDKILFLLYLLVFLFFTFDSEFNINVIIFGTIYLFLLSFILKNSKNTSLIYKSVFLLIPFIIFGTLHYQNWPLLVRLSLGLSINYWIFYFITFALGYYLFENNFYISKKSLIFYVLSLVLFIILFFLELVINVITIDLEVATGPVVGSVINFALSNIYTFKILYSTLFIVFAIFLFLIVYFNGNEILIVRTKIFKKLSEIYKYKKYIFLLIFFIITLQLIIAIYGLSFYSNITLEGLIVKYQITVYKALILLSIFEFIIYFLIYKSMKNDHFTNYFLLFTMVLIIFLGALFTSYKDFTSYALHTRYLMAMIFFFMGIHYKLFSNVKKPIKKAIGITIGILLIIQVVIGELLEFAVYGGPPLSILSIPNIMKILGIIHGLVVTMIILTLIYLHVKLKL